MPLQELGNLKLLQTEPYSAGLLDGYTDRIDLGSTENRLGGIENEISFNGYRFNIKKNIDTVLITSIEGLSDADVRDTREVNPGYDGETAFQSYYGGRTIVLNGRLRAHTLRKLRDMQDGLKSVFAPLEEKPLVFRGQTRDRDLVIYCRKSQPIVMAEIQQGFNFYRDFQVTLRASDFRFATNKIYSTTWESSTGSFGEPNETYNFEEKFVSNIVNSGNYLADLGIKINGPINAATNGGPGILIRNKVDDTFIENSSAVSAVFGITGVQSRTGLTTIENNFLRINAPKNSTVVLGEDEFFVINSTARTITKFNNDVVGGQSAFNQLDISSEWLKLSPGINPIYVTCFKDSNPQITLYSRHTYI